MIEMGGWPAPWTRTRFEIIRGQLELERSTFIGHWRELGEHFLPRRPRFFVNDTDRGNRRHNRIVDSTTIFAAKTLSSGFMAGKTSPARPWVRLTTPDPDLAKYWSVKAWLQKGTDIIHRTFLRSNLYTSLPNVFMDLGTFGTNAMHAQQDFDTVLHTTPFPIGSYAIGMGPRQRIRVFYRTFQYTVRQVVEEFALDRRTGKIDWSKVSARVRWLWKQAHYETWVEMVHAVTPNSDYDERRLEAKYKKFRSVYYERGVIPGESQAYASDMPENLFTRDSGYDRFPVLCPRWDVNSEDVYGTSCPGMDVLGDAKELMVGVKRMKQASEKKLNPPLKGPPALKTSRVSLASGDITYLEEREGQKGLSSIFECNFEIKEHRELLQDLRDHINEGYYKDLFLMLADQEYRKQPITAAEVAERKQEKMLGLGPVLQRLDNELLQPLVEMTFDFCMDQNLIPPPPPELDGHPVYAEYISIMDLAQRAMGIEGSNQFLGVIGNIAKMKPEVLDNVDWDKYVDDMADKYGVDPEVIVPPEQVQMLRAQRQAVQAQQQKIAMAEQLSKAAKNAAQAPTDGDNALSDLLSQGQAGQLIPMSGAA